MNPIKNKKASIAIYFSFIVMAILIVVIAAVLAPMGVLLNTEFYAIGEDILLDANESIADINDATVRSNVYNMLDQAFAAQENNIEVNSDIFQYSTILSSVRVRFP